VGVSDPAPEEFLIATILDKLDKVIIVIIERKLISFLHLHFRDGV
jgi:hypothetical protein